ncbi:MAG TPA: hypothetical protein VFI29_11055 [Hanamia sp.]|nr:hypothetical protein [Hanamia sp.]
MILEKFSFNYCNLIDSRLKKTQFLEMIRILLFTFIATLVFISCTITSTKEKKPIFSKTDDSLQESLTKIVKSENINLDGAEISTNGKVTSELEIDIINGMNIPVNVNEMNDLGKKIAVIIKDALKDKNEYNTYKVLFVTKKINGSVEESTSEGKIFSSRELIRKYPER